MNIEELSRENESLRLLLGAALKDSARLDWLEAVKYDLAESNGQWYLAGLRRGDPNAPMTCPPDCGHSDAEHAAFDRGVEDGEKLRSCPFDHDSQFAEWDAWQTGASVGLLNRATPTK